ncbi:hypothetical protein Z042_16755 [Chania multitudinisentens RB-25]|uniref:Mucoidy inhibitor MuiA family protein n=1 Tax=Chania multitudinisentens RB-25 TaxID=1441930 RepID=W0LGN3_9GAMM|nr:DUF4139 domain-containing protein [Chania multitudinisentens]AHG22881.1 hypothetical protein Z042_16755 [Chania multitudinisentens RB-25]
MTMRIFRITLLCATIVSTYSAAAYAETQVQDVQLNDVTVFIRGAELFNSAKITLPAGESEVIFTNIASDVNEQSLMLDANNGVVIQSSSIKRDFLTENISPEVVQLTAQIEAATREQNQLNAQREVIQAQLSVLESNKALGKEKEGASVEQINQLFELIAKRMSEALLTDIDIKEKIAAIDKNIAKLNNQLKEAQQKTAQAVNQVVVKFYTPKAVTSDIKLSYVIQDAGWVPAYDVRVANINRPVQLSYKANVFQNSGINWNKVNLTLSSGNPSEGAQAPRLIPWYLDLHRDYSLSKMIAREAPMPAMAPAPLADESAELSASDIAAERERQVKNRSLSEYVVTDVGGVNTRFSISLPYNIAADGQGHTVLIKNVDVQGDYRYVVVPKLEQDAFLQVQLKDWESLNLLPGKSSIFFEGSYVGQGDINTKNIKETLDLSLGRDKKIIISRENDKQLTTKSKFFGNSVSQQYSYVMEVKNTRKEPIKLVVLDQVPISRDASIVVDELKYDDANYNKDTGEVKWVLDLAPNQSRQLGLSYTVKYPKNQQITGM